MPVFSLLQVIDVFFWGCLKSGHNDNGARSMAREQSDEYGKTRFLSLDLLYNGGVGWSWYVLCCSVKYPYPSHASLLNRLALKLPFP